MPNPLKEKRIKAMVARRLVEVRKQKNMTQFDLAKAMDCSQGIISMYEAGHTKIDIYTLIDLKNALGCSVDYLVGEDVVYDTSAKGRIFKALESLPGNMQDLVATVAETAANLEQY